MAIVHDMHIKETKVAKQIKYVIVTRYTNSPFSDFISSKFTQFSIVVIITVVPLKLILCVEFFGVFIAIISCHNFGMSKHGTGAKTYSGFSPEVTSLGVM